MTIFTIDIGTDYGKYSIPILEKFCEYNGIKLHVQKEDTLLNVHKLHPSWLKCLCHDLVDDDFILCWDLDLLPTHNYNVCRYIDLDKINLAFDLGFWKGLTSFNKNFKYNCGLIGIPKSESEFFKNVYAHHNQDFRYPSYEQYYINDAIAEQRKQVNVLPVDMNYLYEGDRCLERESVLNFHYTWRINNEEHRTELVRNHKYTDKTLSL
jgi:hypothetical protein